MPGYEQVQVDTGWVRMETGRATCCWTNASRRISKSSGTTIRARLCRKVFKHVMAQAHGEIRPEFAPPFDTLRIDIHMSEPDYESGHR